MNDTTNTVGEGGLPLGVDEEHILDLARSIVERRLAVGAVLESATHTKEYLVVKLATLEHEVFGVVLLNNRHTVIHTEILFRGTVDGASVYPREVVKTALAHNAAAVIFFHNHPSGDPEPSSADLAITERLRRALQTVDIRTLDHIIVGGTRCLSLAERGLI